jgi:hypothetical protein
MTEIEIADSDLDCGDVDMAIGHCALRVSFFFFLLYLQLQLGRRRQNSHSRQDPAHCGLPLAWTLACYGSAVLPFRFLEEVRVDVGGAGKCV